MWYEIIIIITCLIIWIYSFSNLHSLEESNDGKKYKYFDNHEFQFPEASKSITPKNTKDCNVQTNLHACTSNIDCVDCQQRHYQCTNFDTETKFRNGTEEITIPIGKFCAPIINDKDKRTCNSFSGEWILVSLSMTNENAFWVCKCTYPWLITQKTLFDDCTYEIGCKPGGTLEAVYSENILTDSNCNCENYYVAEHLKNIGPICRKQTLSEISQSKDALRNLLKEGTPIIEIDYDDHFEVFAYFPDVTKFDILSGTYNDKLKLSHIYAPGTYIDDSTDEKYYFNSPGIAVAKEEARLVADMEFPGNDELKTSHNFFILQRMTVNYPQKWIDEYAKANNIPTWGWNQNCTFVQGDYPISKFKSETVRNGPGTAQAMLSGDWGTFHIALTSLEKIKTTTYTNHAFLICPTFLLFEIFECKEKCDYSNPYSTLIEFDEITGWKWSVNTNCMFVQNGDAGMARTCGDADSLGDNNINIIRFITQYIGGFDSYALCIHSRSDAKDSHFPIWLGVKFGKNTFNDYDYVKSLSHLGDKYEIDKAIGKGETAYQVQSIKIKQIS